MIADCENERSVSPEINFRSQSERDKKSREPLFYRYSLMPCMNSPVSSKKTISALVFVGDASLECIALLETPPLWSILLLSDESTVLALPLVLNSSQITT